MRRRLIHCRLLSPLEYCTSFATGISSVSAHNLHPSCIRWQLSCEQNINMASRHKARRQGRGRDGELRVLTDELLGHFLSFSSSPSLVYKKHLQVAPTEKWRRERDFLSNAPRCCCLPVLSSAPVPHPSAPAARCQRISFFSLCHSSGCRLGGGGPYFCFATRTIAI